MKPLRYHNGMGMQYRLLGRSGLRVSELCLGTMTFGEEWGWGSSEEESRKVFDAFVEAGGNFFDTADGYTNGSSERMLGSFLASERDRYVVATKFSFSTRPGDPNAGGNHRKHMVEALEASLRRLGLDYVDLYWVHAWDQFTPADEVMRALDDLVRAGKILYAGVSDTPAWVVSQANTLAELRGWTPGGNRGRGGFRGDEGTSREGQGKKKNEVCFLQGIVLISMEHKWRHEHID